MGSTTPQSDSKATPQVLRAKLNSLRRACDLQGITPLMCAWTTEVVDVLLSHGAEILAKDNAVSSLKYS